MGMRRRFTAFAVAVLALTCGAASSKPKLQDISSIDQLRSAFEQDAGKPRLVLLLSPT